MDRTVEKIAAASLTSCNKWQARDTNLILIKVTLQCLFSVRDFQPSPNPR